MKQALNPYLPLYEYVPDGEPRVFGGRIYIYGSHDEAGGKTYCPGDYVTWSAALNDLGNWRFEGVSYTATQDPDNTARQKMLYAPDVVRGVDGRYYLYYCLSFLPEIGVAVSDTPAGPFAFYGKVRYPAGMNGGAVLHEYLPFDPGVLVDEDGKVYLYYGFSPAEKFALPDHNTLQQMGMPEEEIATLMLLSQMETSPGSMVVELEPDMLTLKGSPIMCVPGGKIAQGSSFEGHAFFEASSIRKVNGRYYFIYSSQLSHELCYAVSDRPAEGFVYGGTIISNGDIGYHGNTVPVALTGNNHGSLMEINGAWYVFYHRQTHATEFSRQGCAEKIELMPDGSIPQVEITSCGLNGGPLQASGCYPAVIACYLTCCENREKVIAGAPRNPQLPYIYEEHCGASELDHIQYIANITDGVSFGFKYFGFEGAAQVSVVLRGHAQGVLRVSVDDPHSVPVGEISVKVEGDLWIERSAARAEIGGIHALFFTYTGAGELQVKEISFKTGDNE